MRAVLVPIVAVIFLKCAVNAEYELVGGWTPITIEKVYRSLDMTIPEVNNFQPTKTSWYQNMDSAMRSAIKDDALKIVEPQNFIGNFSVKRFGLTVKVNNTNNNTMRIDDNENAGIETFTAKRKAKNIYQRTLLNRSINNKIEKQSGNLIDPEVITSSKETTAIKPYEVTEDPEKLDTEPLKTESKSGYVYSAPEINTTPNKFTNVFLSILDKYNINNRNQLENYSKSRVPNIQTARNEQFVYLPVPLHIIERYNSLNHLSVDPLMAVLLSNYGHYLPRLYGIQNNYKNLYGYLASNNIHNNKPFGSYKIFSDTDSSN